MRKSERWIVGVVVLLGAAATVGLVRVHGQEVIIRNGQLIGTLPPSGHQFLGIPKPPPRRRSCFRRLARRSEWHKAFVHQPPKKGGGR